MHRATMRFRGDQIPASINYNFMTGLSILFIVKKKEKRKLFDYNMGAV